LHSYEDIPALLGIDEADSRLERGQAHRLHGRSLFYSTAIGTDPKFVDVIIEQTRAFDPKRQVLQSAS
jgi:sirohydrochlorin cobaltochelatase